MCPALTCTPQDLPALVVDECDISMVIPPAGGNVNQTVINTEILATSGTVNT
jgi:hypothetical protein